MNHEEVTGLMRQWFDNKNEIGHIKSERNEMMNTYKCNDLRKEVNNETSCIDRLRAENEFPEDIALCPFCSKRHDYYKNLQKLSRANAGIINKVRNRIYKNS